MGGFMKRLLFISALLIASCQGLSSDLPQPILVGIGTEAKWSPDEKAISFLRGDSLYVKSLSPEKPAQGIYYASIVTYEWLDDSSFAAFERDELPIRGGKSLIQRITKISLEGKSVEIAKDSANASSRDFKLRGLRRFPDGSVGYFDETRMNGEPIRLSEPTSSSLKPVVATIPRLFLKTEPASRGIIWLCYGDAYNCRQITKSENYYGFPYLAPNGERLFASNSRAHKIVFDTLGNEIADLGLIAFAGWDPTSQYVVYCEIVESEYGIDSSEVFYTKYDGTEKTQLTTTPDQVEDYPRFSPSSRYILYHVYPSNELYVVKVR
jgi:hypothetical protein